jgi:hypothetical protein
MLWISHSASSGQTAKRFGQNAPLTRGLNTAGHCTYKKDFLAAKVLHQLLQPF